MYCPENAVLILLKAVQSALAVCAKLIRVEWSKVVVGAHPVGVPLFECLQDLLRISGEMR